VSGRIQQTGYETCHTDSFVQHLTAVLCIQVQEGRNVKYITGTEKITE